MVHYQYSFAIRDFRKADFCFSVGDVLRVVDGARGGSQDGYYEVEHNGQRQWIGSEYIRFINELEKEAFQEGAELGKGAFGRVVRATHPSTPTTVFVKKTISIPGASRFDPGGEIWRMYSAVHKHVVDFVMVATNGPSIDIYMLPLADRNLEEHLQLVASQNTNAEFGPRRLQIFRWINCLAMTLAQIHRRDIVHRDIKPQNILVHGNNILYTDFGIAYTRDDTTDLSYTSTDGTYEWIPPEAIQIDRDNKEKSVRAGCKGDVFSLGCVIYEMLLVASPERFMNISLPSRQNEEVMAYHLTVVNDGGFAPCVKAVNEDIEQVRESLGAEHTGYVGMTKDLLEIVAYKMLVLQGKRASSKDVAYRIMRAMDRRQLSPSLCCAK